MYSVGESVLNFDWLTQMHNCINCTNTQHEIKQISLFSLCIINLDSGFSTEFGNCACLAYSWIQRDIFVCNTSLVKCKPSGLPGTMMYKNILFKEACLYSFLSINNFDVNYLLICFWVEKMQALCCCAVYINDQDFRHCFNCLRSIVTCRKFKKTRESLLNCLQNGNGAI